LLTSAGCSKIRQMRGSEGKDAMAQKWLQGSGRMAQELALECGGGPDVGRKLLILRGKTRAAREKMMAAGLHAAAMSLQFSSPTLVSRCACSGIVDH